MMIVQHHHPRLARTNMTSNRWSNPYWTADSCIPCLIHPRRCLRTTPTQIRSRRPVHRKEWSLWSHRTQVFPCYRRFRQCCNPTCLLPHPLVKLSQESLQSSCSEMRSFRVRVCSSFHALELKYGAQSRQGRDCYVGTWQWFSDLDDILQRGWMDCQSWPIPPGRRWGHTDLGSRQDSDLHQYDTPVIRSRDWLERCKIRGVWSAWRWFLCRDVP